MKRVLVTGATGFVGRWALRPLISSGYEVHATFRREQLATDLPIRWHQADLLQTDSIGPLIRNIQPTHLLHFAWYLEHGKFWNAMENVDYLAASLALLRVFAANGGERFVGAGTVYEYDHAKGDLCEDAPIGPTTLYGVTKDAFRRVVQQVASARLSWAWGRIFFVYGPNEGPKRFVASVARSLLHGEDAKCSHGRQIRDFMHVEDAGAGFAALLQSNVRGCVNIATGEAVSLRDIAKKLQTIISGRGMVRLGAVEAAANDPPRLVAQVQRLRDEVGFTPRWTLDAGLTNTVAALRGS